VLAAPTKRHPGALPTADATLAARDAASSMAEGAAARAEAGIEAEGAAWLALQRAGYANAATGERRVVVDHATNRVSTEFRFEPGSVVRLGVVRAEPDDLFRRSFVEDLQNWEDGARYRPRMLTRLRRDMTSTGAVSLASTRIEPPDADGVSDVVLVVEPVHRNAYELGVSYSTTEGAGVTGEWTRRNFTRRADSLTVGATLAEMQQGVTATWARPHAAGLNRTLSLGASAEREMIEAYTRQGVAIYGSVDAAPRLELGTSYGLRLAADQYDDVSGDFRNAIVLSAFGAVRRDTTDVRLDARDGSIVELRLEPSVSAGDTSLAFVRSTAEGRIYESFGDEDRLTMAARLRTGWLEAVSGSADDVPPDRRFYAGGGGSVRGYEYNSIYPGARDALDLTPGGQGLLEGSIEARYRFNNRWGAAVFADAGNAFDDWGDATDLSWGVGAGVRYDLGFAPMRVDFAVPLDQDESGDDFAVYISLGQAF
jgi:translocation and assembly module TamA